LAVKKIDQIANKDYVVLSNQLVSAAAIKKFGFKKYYKDSSNNLYFFYAIPTGSKLYQIYLDMVYDQPCKKTAKKAAKLVNVKEVYFVINNYWSQFEKIIQQAIYNCDKYYIINKGKIFIFKYSF
jgi:hypothetical protein